MKKCNEDCFNCPFEDCMREDILPSDAKEIKERDKRLREGAIAFANVPTARKAKRKLCKI